MKWILKEYGAELAIIVVMIIAIIYGIVFYVLRKTGG